MAQMPGKGTVVQQTISMAFAAVAQVLDIEHSGSESLTYDGTTLDGGVYKEYPLTGYSEPGTVAYTIFYDAALAGHQFHTDRITTPATNAMKIIYSDAATTEQAFTSSGVAFGVTVAMDNGVTATITHQVSGDPGWPT